MEPALGSIVALAAMFAVSLIVDLGGACVENIAARRLAPPDRSAVRVRVPRLVATLVAAALVAMLRPATGAVAVTPPPSVRIADPASTMGRGVTPSDDPVPGVLTDRIGTDMAGDVGTGPPAARSGDLEQVYTVVSGDCLWRIARHVLLARSGQVSGADIANLWKVIYDRNRGVIGDDPNLIIPGQILHLPAETISRAESR